jgi:hypothetical protein
MSAHPIDKRVAQLSDADRQALIEGRPFGPQRRSGLRLIRGVSQEADGLHILLQRAGGERSIRSLVTGTNLGSFVGAASSELAELGLVERAGNGEAAVLRLTPAAEGVILTSSWSMR